MMKVDLLLNQTHLIEEIAKLKFQEFNYLVPEKSLEDFIKSLHEHCNEKSLPITWVSLEERTLLGTFSLRPFDLDSHNQLSPWLGSVVVPKDQRNKGIGAFLVSEAEKKAREMGYRFLYLFTPNKAKWYAKQGWEVIEISQFNKIPISIMKKNL